MSVSQLSAVILAMSSRILSIGVPVRTASVQQTLCLHYCFEAVVPDRVLCTIGLLSILGWLTTPLRL